MHTRVYLLKFRWVFCKIFSSLKPSFRHQWVYNLIQRDLAAQTQQIHHYHVLAYCIQGRLAKVSLACSGYSCCYQVMTLIQLYDSQVTKLCIIWPNNIHYSSITYGIHKFIDLISPYTVINCYTTRQIIAQMVTRRLLLGDNLWDR